MKDIKFCKNPIILKGTCPRNIHDFCRTGSNNLVYALQQLCLFFKIRSFFNEATIHPLKVKCFYSFLACKIAKKKCIKQCYKDFIQQLYAYTVMVIMKNRTHSLLSKSVLNNLFFSQTICVRLTVRQAFTCDSYT